MSKESFDIKKLYHIDFEYQVNDSEMGQLICCSIFDPITQKIEHFWLFEDKEKAHLKSYIKSIASIGGALCGHGIELAEARCVKKLGLNPLDFNWLDSYIAIKLVENYSVKIGTKQKNDLASVTERVLGIQRDSSHKKEMQLLCANGKTEELIQNKEEIMSYCDEDVIYMPQLINKIKEKYDEMNHVSLFQTGKKHDFFDVLFNLSKIAVYCSLVSDKGLPVDYKQCQQLRDFAPKKIEELKEAFFSDFPELGKKNKNEWSFTLANVLEKLNQEAEKLHLKGVLNLQSDEIEKHFRGKSEFVNKYLALKDEIRQYQGIAKDWLQNVSPCGRVFYQSLRPFQASTGRCGVMPSSGFIPLWDKRWFYLISPQKGMKCFEIDFCGQEFYFASCLYNDKTSQEIYSSPNDQYIEIIYRVGKCSKEDLSLSKGEFEKIHPGMRAKFKAAFLGFQYGISFSGLAKNLDILTREAKELLFSLKNLFKEREKRENALLSIGEKNPTKQMIHLPNGWGVVIRPNEKQNLSFKNFPIQGMGSVILFQCLKELRKRWENEEKERNVLGTVHDAIIFECKDQDFDIQSKKAENIMKEVVKKTLKKICPLSNFPEIKTEITSF